MSNDDWDVLPEDADEFTCCANPDSIFLGSFTNDIRVRKLPGLFRLVEDVVSFSWCTLRLRELPGFQGCRVSLLGGGCPS